MPAHQSTGHGGAGDSVALRCLDQLFSDPSAKAKHDCGPPMPLQFLPDEKLYQSYDHYAQEFAPTFPAHTDDIIFHWYWSGPISELHLFSLKSLLLTQTPPYSLRIWCPPEQLTERLHALADLARLNVVDIQPFDPRGEAQGTPYDGLTELLEPDTVVLRGDEFRAIALFKYGGVYVDPDVLMLKDLRPLLSVEFCYAWALEPYANSAVLRLHAGSANAHSLLLRGGRAHTFHPRMVFRYTDSDSWPEPMHVLPSFVFDPAWVGHDSHLAATAYCTTFDDFFNMRREMTLSAFFPHSFAYHWHKRWNTSLQEGSIAWHLKREVDDLFERHFG